MTKEEIDQLFERINQLSDFKRRCVLSSLFGTISFYVGRQDKTSLEIIERLEEIVTEKEGWAE